MSNLQMNAIDLVDRGFKYCVLIDMKSGAARFTATGCNKLSHACAYVGLLPWDVKSLDDVIFATQVADELERLKW